MDMWIWLPHIQCGLTWPEEGTMASNDPLVIKELFMPLESTELPIGFHWASTQNPPNYWGQSSGHCIQQAEVIIS